MTFALSDFDYPLDQRLVATEPKEQRDHSRLMVLSRHNGTVSHRIFHDLVHLLHPRDLLVLNDTAVVPALFFCQRSSGGKIEGLFLRQVELGLWEIMLKGAGRCKAGERLEFCREASADASGQTPPSPLANMPTLVLRANLGQGRWQAVVEPVAEAMAVLARVGQPPLPPYIRSLRKGQATDFARYQTVYARSAGAVAAPTAGLHFTQELLAQLANKGIDQVRVTLHVGAGTFAPVKSEDLSQHVMHQESFPPQPRRPSTPPAQREGGLLQWERHRSAYWRASPPCTACRPPPAAGQTCSSTPLPASGWWMP